jgi:phosphatidylglycerophosphatase A
MSTNCPSPSPSPTAWAAPVVLAATCGGIGFLRFAPGTWGAAVGLVVVGMLETGLRMVSAPEGLSAVIVVMVNLIGVPICTGGAARLGGDKDPGPVIYDEAAAMAALIIAVPAWVTSPWGWLLAFGLFRLFDILKPAPCRALERLPAGLGIMADDWAAAVWVVLLLWAPQWLGVWS